MPCWPRSAPTTPRCGSSSRTGRDESYSFGALSERSDQVAGWLRGEGVRRGMQILVVLGNQVELWEITLAAMKLGAVIIPATTLLVDG